jgi:hypothetical protein
MRSGQMKAEKALNKAYAAFLGDEDDALLRLAILKERADYRAYFAENIGKVKAADSLRKEGKAKRPYTPDEETEKTFHRFREEMHSLRHPPSATLTVRRGMGFSIPNRCEAAPAVWGDSPWLFYWPGVRGCTYSL